MINYEYPPLGGGGGIFTRDLAEELAKSHNVDVLTTHFKDLKKEEKVNNVNIYRVSVIQRTSLRTATMPSLLSFPLSGILKGASLMRRKKYDIINTHFAVPSGPVGSILSKLFKIPNVLSIHGGDIYDPSKKLSPHRHAIFRWAVRSALNNAAGVVAQSTNTKDYANKLYFPNKNISIIQLGLPEPKFEKVSREELSMKKDVLYLISIGRLVKRKGYDFLVKALKILKDRGQDINLILVGDGPEREYLESLASSSGISDKIIFLGSVPDEEKFQYLSASDIYVLPSLHEGFGIVLVEAMRCGLPIVATNEGGQTDIIKDEKNGILIPPRDVDALAIAISELASNLERRKTMTEFNKKSSELYSISHTAEQYIDLFNSVIQKQGRTNVR